MTSYATSATVSRPSENLPNSRFSPSRWVVKDGENDEVLPPLPSAPQGGLSAAIRLQLRTLTCVDLTGTMLGLEGVETLAHELIANDILVTLTLRATGLGSEGMKLLAGVIATNDLALSTIDVSENQLGAEGGAYLGSALETNSSLRVIDLRSNGIRGGREILIALGTNTFVTTFHLLEGNHFTSAVIDQVNAFLARNCRFSEVFL